MIILAEPSSPANSILFLFTRCSHSSLSFVAPIEGVLAKVHPGGASSASPRFVFASSGLAELAPPKTGSFQLSNTPVRVPFPSDHRLLVEDGLVDAGREAGGSVNNTAFVSRWDFIHFTRWTSR